MISKLNNKMYLFSSCKIQSSNFYTHIFFIVILLSTSLHAQDYYVSHELGSDGNNGLETSPFQTINRAISEVEAGGTVYVMEGTYRNLNYGTVDPSTNTNMSNPHVVTINKSGLENNYITLKNYPGHSPVIEFDGKGGIQIADDMNYIIVEGFEVIGPSQAINYDMAMDNRAYKVAVAEDGDSSTNYNHSYFSGKGIWGGYGSHHHIIIRNNIVHDTPGSGIRFNDSDHITIENNTVYNTTWWTSSASSAVVYAETIASSEPDNGIDIKMIMRGNLIYNNWNRIPFYVTQLPDNSGNENPNYGTADYNSIVDGQGLYVTRSDPNYNGTFLFENNVCVNNGKNGINFDNSLAASAIIRNNTLYFNGVHEYIQDLSVAEGNPSHRGQNVAGIKSNKVLNSTVVNNIVITRPLEDAPSYYENGFTALQLNQVSGSKIANNNLFLNGTYAWPATSENNIVDQDPLFVLSPAVVNGPIDISATDFSITPNSPAIDAGDPSYSPIYDFLGNSRPIVSTAISSSSFENSTGGWSAFGSTVELSQEVSKTGNSSLLTSNRTLYWHSPKLVLDNLLTVGETYTFYVWVKLAQGVSGTSQLTIKNTTLNTYTNLTSVTASSDQEWTLLTGDYTYGSADNLFVYVKGPTIDDGGGDYFIDDFSLMPQGSPAVDFSNVDDIVDIGAYEFLGNSLSAISPSDSNSDFILYPNPASDRLQISNLLKSDIVLVYDLFGKTYKLSQTHHQQTRTIEVSNLSTGLYILKIINPSKNKIQTLRFIKH
ncbi:MAG: carbohydrate binding domain-containing protein [Flavobacteriaceae bacterium]